MYLARIRLTIAFYWRYITQIQLNTILRLETQIEHTIFDTHNYTNIKKGVVGKRGSSIPIAASTTKNQPNKTSSFFFNF